jgi:multisubunit Na+/H+ antiporter MnhG subunit
MGLRLSRWLFGLGLGSMLLLALLLLLSPVTIPSVAHAAEKADLLDINTATVDQLKAAPRHR